MDQRMDKNLFNNKTNEQGILVLIIQIDNDKNKVTGSLCACLSVAKDLTNRETDIVPIYSEASYRSRSGKSHLIFILLLHFKTTLK